VERPDGVENRVVIPDEERTGHGRHEHERALDDGDGDEKKNGKPPAHDRRIRI
jgi:hypothetical protein